MILIIDNYDSFVYNIYQYVREYVDQVCVRRNDEITLEEIERLQPDAIIISPGPGYPSEAGITEQVITHFANCIPLLGICLGHQAIGEVFGGKIIKARQPIHGKTRLIQISQPTKLFKGLSQQLKVGRYHSLVIEKSSLPTELEVLALSEDGEIMAVKHKVYDTYGIQFHPESILTLEGRTILKNFLKEIAKLPILEKEEEQRSQDEQQLKPYLQKVITHENLTQTEAECAMQLMMKGKATSAQIGAFLTALRMKGETIEEITGFAKIMRQLAKGVSIEESVIDIVGTGGDLAQTFNISTTTAFVVAGAGLKVAKHGNRSVSSLSGSADVLEALGVQIELTPELAQRCLKEIGICFMFAPCFHEAMRFAAPPRREIGVRSIFNILGPLANPACAEYFLLGVYDGDLLEVMGRVLMNLGVKKAVVVHGADGLDEVSLSGATQICEIEHQKIIKYTITPEEFGLSCCDLDQIKGGEAKDNAKITRDILAGKRGPKRDIVVFNAGVALYSGRQVQSIQEGITLAEQVIDSGKALAKLEALKALTQEVNK